MVPRQVLEALAIAKLMMDVQGGKAPEGLIVTLKQSLGKHMKSRFYVYQVRQGVCAREHARAYVCECVGERERERRSSIAVPNASFSLALRSRTSYCGYCSKILTSTSSSPSMSPALRHPTEQKEIKSEIVNIERLIGHQQSAVALLGGCYFTLYYARS